MFRCLQKAVVKRRCPNTGVGPSVDVARDALAEELERRVTMDRTCFLGGGC